MPFFKQGYQQLAQLTAEILRGIRDGTMTVTNIEMRWDKGQQQSYYLEVLDVQRTVSLSKWAQTMAAPGYPVPISVIPTFIEKEPAIQDLGIITEPIIGFRDFYLGNGPYPMPGLVSRNKAPWPMREPMRAFCRAGALSAHDAPDINCECGIYAFSNPVQDGLLSTGVIWGEIAMWGEVLIAEKGYRAEFAYPKTLFIQDTGTRAIKWLRDHLANSYGVPVFLVEERENKTAGEIIGEMLAALQ